MRIDSVEAPADLRCELDGLAQLELELQIDDAGIAGDAFNGDAEASRRGTKLRGVLLAWFGWRKAMPTVLRTS